jgi:hypothetical protein
MDDAFLLMADEKTLVDDCREAARNLRGRQDPARRYLSDVDDWDW